MTFQPASMRRRPETAAAPPIRVMVVDDSSVARAVLSRMIGACPDLKVVALAGRAGEALDMLRTVAVDIILLDIAMPGGNGLDALPEIIAAADGARVLIVSSMAEEGAEITVRALALGAADALPKPGTGNFAGRFAEILADRLRRIGRVGREARPSAAAPETPPVTLRDMPDGPTECIALGASTGGLHALISFLKALPDAMRVPILVTQHLPPLFMPYFARQLEAATGRTLRIAEEGVEVAAGLIHVAPGDAHLCVERRGVAVRIRLDRKRAPSGCLPSVDPMFSSLAETYGACGLGVVLSGMGRDGLAGSRRLVERGGAVLVQDRHSAAIWGMPRVVAEAGLASAVLAPPDLARRIAARAEGARWK